MVLPSESNTEDSKITNVYCTTTVLQIEENKEQDGVTDVGQMDENLCAP